MKCIDTEINVPRVFKINKMIFHTYFANRAIYMLYQNLFPSVFVLIKHLKLRLCNISGLTYGDIWLT